MRAETQMLVVDVATKKDSRRVPKTVPNWGNYLGIIRIMQEYATYCCCISGDPAEIL